MYASYKFIHAAYTNRLALPGLTRVPELIVFVLLRLDALLFGLLSLTTFVSFHLCYTRLASWLALEVFLCVASTTTRHLMLGTVLQITDVGHAAVAWADLTDPVIPTWAVVLSAAQSTFGHINWKIEIVLFLDEFYGLEIIFEFLNCK